MYWEGLAVLIQHIPAKHQLQAYLHSKQAVSRQSQAAQVQFNPHDLMLRDIICMLSAGNFLKLCGFPVVVDGLRIANRANRASAIFWEFRGQDGLRVWVCWGHGRRGWLWGLSWRWVVLRCKASHGRKLGTSTLHAACTSLQLLTNCDVLNYAAPGRFQPQTPDLKTSHTQSLLFFRPPGAPSRSSQFLRCCCRGIRISGLVSRIQQFKFVWSVAACASTIKIYQWPQGLEMEGKIDNSCEWLRPCVRIFEPRPVCRTFFCGVIWVHMLLQALL